MKKIIDLSKAGHAITPQIKQLHLESQNGHSGIYKEEIIEPAKANK